MRRWINLQEDRLLCAGPREWKLMAAGVCQLAWDLLPHEEREILVFARTQAIHSTSFHLDRRLAGYRKLQSEMAKPSGTWPLISHALDGFDTGNSMGLLANVELALESFAILRMNRPGMPPLLIKALEDTFLPGPLQAGLFPPLALSMAVDLDGGDWSIYGILADVLEDGDVRWLQKVARSLKYKSVACMVNSLLPCSGNWIVDLLCGRRSQWVSVESDQDERL